MVFGKQCRSAMITVELAVSLTLIVVVLLVTIGLFGDNLRSMIESGRYKNIYNNADDRTVFSFFNKNYTDSQIDVSITGEQGLEKIRMLANNGSIDTIGNPATIPTTLSSGSGSALVYYRDIISIIVHNGAICKRMDKPSLAPCGTGDLAQNPTQYQAVSISNGTLTVNDASGNKIATASNVMEYKGSLPSNVYQAIQTLTNYYKGNLTVSSSVLNDILNILISYFESKTGTSVGGANKNMTNDIKSEILILISALKASISSANQVCGGSSNKRDSDHSYENGKYDNGNGPQKNCFPSIVVEDVGEFNSQADSIIKSVNSLNPPDDFSPQTLIMDKQMINYLWNATGDIEHSFMGKLQQDVATNNGKQTSCSLLINGNSNVKGLLEIAKEHHLYDLYNDIKVNQLSRCHPGIIYRQRKCTNAKDGIATALGCTNGYILGIQGNGYDVKYGPCNNVDCK